MNNRKQRELEELERKKIEEVLEAKETTRTALFGLALLIFNFMLLLFLWSYISNQVEKEEQAYLAERHDGFETYALVADKYTKGNVGSKSGGYIAYYAVLYTSGQDVPNENYKKQISLPQYQQLNQGDFIEVVIKDKEIYLGNKQDKKEAIHLVYKQISNENSQEK